MIPYFEILEFGKVIKRFRLSLSDISFDNELMTTPSISITNVPEIIPYLHGRKEIKVHTQYRTFYGSTTGVTVNTSDNSVDINMSHIISEWTFRQVPTNYAVKNKTVPQAYVNEELKYSKEWGMSFDKASQGEAIDYVYSRQNKLDALTKTCELTKYLWWRVPFVNDKEIEVGEFGEKKPYTVSLRPSGKHNIRILEEPTVSEDFSSVINMATVYSEKSDNGMTSLTLREVYNDKDLQDDAFPVVILDNKINNERDYQYIEFPKLAPNNQLEYAILDSESIAMESGIFIEGTFAFNDLSPFSLSDLQKNNTTTANSNIKWVVPTEQRYLTDEESLNNARCIYEQLKGKWSNEAICALIGCAYKESTLNPNIYQGLNPNAMPLSQEGFGLVQWTPYTRITNWLNSHGYKVQDYGKGEINKLLEEWETNATNAEWIPTSSYNFTFKQWSQMHSDMTTMCMAWMVNYGRGDTSIDLHYGERIAYAQKILNLIPEWVKQSATQTIEEIAEQSNNSTNAQRKWSPSSFVNQYKNKAVDMDGAPAGDPYQCVDTFKLIRQVIGDPNYNAPIGGDGYAHQIWYQREQYSKYFTFHTSNPEYGDVAVWSMGGGDTPYSHVAMYVGGSKFFGQNQAGHKYHDTQTINMSNILGYLRVKPEYWKRTPTWAKGENATKEDLENGVQEVSDADRIYAGKTVYDATVKKLINARRKFQITVRTEQLPQGLNVGDKIRFQYDMTSWHLEECSNYMRKLLTQDDWFYITRIGFQIDNTGIETGELTLEKFLRIDRAGNKENVS